MAALTATLLGLGVPAVAAGPERVCRVGDERLTELSGLAAAGSGYVVVNDGVDRARQRRIFFLDGRCRVVRSVPYPSRPRDTEDLAIATDGTVWVADIGDNSRSRTSIALWRLAAGTSTPRLYRMAYPDGAHDAEAMLLTRAGTPVVVTKAVGGASVYVPDGPLRAGRTTALRRAGAVALPVTGTANPFGLPGRLLITGGAVSPDGRRATLRTYADAFEFDVPGDDLVRAITEGTPHTIPLPDEPQGEAVAYTPDGTALLTISEITEMSDSADLLRYSLPGRAPGQTPAGTDPAAPPPSRSTADPQSRSTADPPPSPDAGSVTATGAPAASASTRRATISTGAVITGVVLAAAAAVLGTVLVRRRRTRA